MINSTKDLPKVLVLHPEADHHTSQSNMFSPPLIDCVFQSAMVAWAHTNTLMVPMSISNLDARDGSEWESMWQGGSLWSRTIIRELFSDAAVFDCTFFNASFRVVLRF